MRRASEVSRLETFSDGVFAFSATLLVVSLEVPDGFDDLVANLYGFIPFSLSFGTLILLWSVHRGFFRRFPLTDGWTLCLNSTLLFVILFYVYPLKFMARGLVASLGLYPAGATLPKLQGASDVATLFLLYSGGFAAIFVCVGLLYRHAAGQREALGLDPAEVGMARMLSRHYFLFVLMGAVSMVLAATGIGLRWGMPGWAYALLGPLCYGHAKWSENRGEVPDRVAIMGSREDEEKE